MDEKEITKVIAKFYGDFVEPEIKGIKEEIGGIKGEIKEIKGQQEKFQIALDGVRLDIKEVKETLQEHDKKFDRIYGHVDGLYGEFKRIEIR